MEIEVLNKSGKKVGVEEIDADGIKFIKFPQTAHQAVRTIMSARRRGTHDSKTRAEVRGGGQKPWRQKGTGRARIGSIRAPHWTGGGTVFGPKPRDHSLDMPKKMKRRVLAEAIIKKLTEGKSLIVKETGVKDGKTAEAVKFLKSLKIEGNTIVVLPGELEMERRAFSNIPDAKVLSARELNTYEMLWCKNLIMEKTEFGKIKELISA